MRIRRSICRLFVFLAFFASTFSLGNPKNICSAAFAAAESAAIRLGMRVLYPDAYHWLYGDKNIPRRTHPIKPSAIDPSIGGFSAVGFIEVPYQNKLALSPDGNLVAVSGSSSIFIQNIHQPNENRTLSLPLGDVSISTMTFSPNGQQLAIATSGNSRISKSMPEILVLNSDTGKVQKRIGNLKFPPTKLAISPDGNQLGVIYASTNDLDVWDLSQGLSASVKDALRWQKPLAKLVVRPYAVDLAFTPNQNKNATALTTLSLNDGTLSVWDYKKGNLLSEEKNNGNLSQIHVNESGEAMVMTTTLGKLSVENPKNGETRSLLGGLGQGESGRSGLLSQDGNLLLLRTYPDLVMIFKK